MFNLTEVINHLKVSGKVKKLENAGDILQYLIPWAALVVVAFTGSAELAWTWLNGCLLTLVVVHLIKKVSNLTPWGKRPNGGDNSFPSAHTSGAVSGAAFFYFAFGPYVAIVPGLLALLTGFSRVAGHHHWIRDVVAGAGIAIACMYYVFTN